MTVDHYFLSISSVIAIGSAFLNVFVVLPSSSAHYFSDQKIKRPAFLCVHFITDHIVLRRLWSTMRKNSSIQAHGEFLEITFSKTWIDLLRQATIWG